MPNLQQFPQSSAHLWHKCIDHFLYLIFNGTVSFDPYKGLIRIRGVKLCLFDYSFPEKLNTFDVPDLFAPRDPNARHFVAALTLCHTVAVHVKFISLRHFHTPLRFF